MRGGFYMKNGKRLSAQQRKHVESLGMNSADWLIAKKLEDIWTLVHRQTGQSKEVRSEKW